MKESTLTQANHTLTILSQKKVTAEDLRILHDGFLADLVDGIKGGKIPDRDAIRRAFMLPPFDYHIAVIHGMTVGERIDAGGYDEVGDENTSRTHLEEILREAWWNFGAESMDDGVVNLYYPGKELCESEVLQLCSNHGYRPATWREGLAFGAGFPLLQQKFPIVVLDPTPLSQNTRYSLVLESRGRRRLLRMYKMSSQESKFLDCVRFLVVRR